MNANNNNNETGNNMNANDTNTATIAIINAIDNMFNDADAALIITDVSDTFNADADANADADSMMLCDMLVSTM